MELDFLIFVAVGAVAQLVDGAIGMGYGVLTTIFLLNLGLAPAPTSATVHACKVVTGAASGLSHAYYRNIDGALLRRLVVPGVIGGVVGAYILTTVPGQTVKPFIAAYLLLMGLIILRRALQRRGPAAPVGRRLLPLGLAGGFFDAIGGGGWGPIVTSTLVATGTPPRYAIGSVNLAEFFVAIFTSATFFLTIGLVYWRVIAGLMLGGILAAPVAAYLTKRLPARPVMIVVGLVIVALSSYTLYVAVS